MTGTLNGSGQHPRIVAYETLEGSFAMQRKTYEKDGAAKEIIRTMPSGELKAKIFNLKVSIEGLTRELHDLEDELSQRHYRPITIYVFPSKSLRHIEIAVESCLWAVRKPSGGLPALSKLQGRAKNLAPGSLGVFYDSCNHNLLVPFKVKSPPDIQRAVQGAPWPGEHVCPFEIEPIGKMWGSVNRRHLPTLLERSIRDRGIKRGDWHHVLHIAPMYTFSPSRCYRDEWEEVMELLSSGCSA